MSPVDTCRFPGTPPASLRAGALAVGIVTWLQSSVIFYGCTRNGLGSAGSSYPM